jgi:hypothetical protein
MDIDLSCASVPDATTLMGFGHLLQAHALSQAMLVEINAMLIERGLLMSQGTLVDATLIAAPSSTKNKDHARDSEMHQTMKAHIGVDKRGDMQEALKANAQTVKWHVAKRRKSVEKLDEGWQKDLAQAYDKLKAQVRAYVEHPFHNVKNIFRYKKALATRVWRKTMHSSICCLHWVIYAWSEESYAHKWARGRKKRPDSPQRVSKNTVTDGKLIKTPIEFHSVKIRNRPVFGCTRKLI